MRRLLVVLAAAAAFFAPSMAGQGKGHGKGHAKGLDKREAAAVFAPGDRSYLSGYFRSNGLPPGLAKKSDLPPGLEKQLRKNGRLPPGLEKKLVPFPVEVERRLPPCPPDVHRGFMGGVAVMYNSRTGLLLDVFAVTGR